MGNIIDQHAAPARHLAPEKYTRDAFIHWNGPLLQHADDLLTAALNRHFEVTWPGKWRFTNTSSRPDQLKLKHVSKVVDRLRSERSKLPFMETRTIRGLADAEGAEADQPEDDTGVLADTGAFEVEDIVAYRFNRRESRDEWQVRWKGYSASANTWEPYDNLLGDAVRAQADALKHSSVRGSAPSADAPAQASASAPRIIDPSDDED